jgi:hypothetical protein
MMTTFPRMARWLGLAGIAPQLWVTLMVFANSELRWGALAVGYAYAALIFSFIGGMWWGMAISSKNSPTWIYAAAVTPSLIALATYIPWVIGATWPVPSLAVLGICVIFSPLVDMAIGQSLAIPNGWMRFRIMLSSGLGGMTLLMALAR